MEDNESEPCQADGSDGEASESSAAQAGTHRSDTRSQERSTADRYVEEIRRTNALIPGQLVLHYRTRDVAVAVDGASAMRIISTWQQRPSTLLRIDPQWSSAKWSWLAIDLDELMGILWVPDSEGDTDGNPDRVTVDPYI